MIKILLVAWFLFSILHLNAASSKHLLVEAESFQKKGGWVVDPQFSLQMGSPYLLAHGMGKPVENASATVIFPVRGDFHVWVRTKNWVPGNWEAPGRFKLIVNGKAVGEVLGTVTGWSWQYAGVVAVDKIESTLELKDLTGFEGRCDAVYFSTSKTEPPSEPVSLSKWRQKMLGESSKPGTVLKFDFVVVGGGIAGCAAAIAAAEQGLDVAIIHDRPVLGGNASGEIRVHTEGITGYSSRIVSMLNTSVWYENGSPAALKDDSRRHANMEKYKNITLFLNFKAFQAESKGNKVKSVDARHTSSGETKRFTAPVFADCTGDGWIGYWAKAEYMYGREDSAKFGESWPKYGDLWSSAKGDNRVMGASVLWRTVDTKAPSLFPEVPWAMEVAKGYAATKGVWQWEYSDNNLNQIEDAEQIRDHLLRAIYGSFYNAKKEAANRNLELEWVGYIGGKRESRRLVGDHIYTFNDEKQMIQFEDAVVVEERDVDVHYQEVIKDSDKPDFLSAAMFYKVERYYIPYRSLYSKNITNLLMAGRCFSCSHVGLGGPRVMNTTGQMGVAVGYAAALCKKYKETTRGIYRNHLEELLNLVNGN
ncbi:MAG TPA: FAD-dependent oxidoreductase [Prolixibacteraceae bacterium]|nr:FAD-dependent oxidoreductase [Prolixibacteraceae bacterium]